MTLFVIQSFDVDTLLIWQAANTKNLRKWPVPLNTSLLELYLNRKYSFVVFSNCMLSII